MDKEEIFVTKTYMPPMEEYIAEIGSLWETSRITNMGSKHLKLAEELKKYLCADNIELFVNGHMALESILHAMLRRDGEHCGAEIITTPYTFASTTHAIVREGMVPVFCDIRKSDCTIDPEKIESLITDRTVAIVPVHVYGQICDVDAIQDIADRHGLKVIYDAAHAFGESYRGVGVADFGDASMFSFHATKVYHTIEGGAVCFRDSELAAVLYQLKNFGITDYENVEYVGGNAKLNEFSAAMGLVNLRHVDELIAERKNLAELYRSLLTGVPGIRLLEDDKDTAYNYAYMPAFFEGKTGSGMSREEVYSRLTGENIFPRKYFYPTVNAYSCYRDTYDPTDTPVAYEAASQVLTLPLYPELPPEEIARICRIIVNK